MSAWEGISDWPFVVKVRSAGAEPENAGAEVFFRGLAAGLAAFACYGLVAGFLGHEFALFWGHGVGVSGGHGEEGVESELQMET